MKPFNFRFIDLFAGIGGFHQAMRYLGGTCVMAAEINQECVNTYNKNFSTEEGIVRGDVNEIDPASIAHFDVLCAGFPCQPFSKAGQQMGFSDKNRGNLFYKIMDILDGHSEVKFIILENVRNLADKTENWDIITSELRSRNFYITESPVILSPSDFGIPQIRERVYILGIRKDIRNETILTNGFIHIEDMNLEKHRKSCKLGDAWSILENDVDDSYIIPAEQELMIQAWDELRINTGIKVLGFPLWLDSFGVGNDDTEVVYASQGYDDMPGWKKNFLRRNRELYLSNQEYIDLWVEKYNMKNRIKLYKKFEWNCGKDVKDIKESLIQVRQSGIRAKRPTFYPSLVAIVNTPIVWDKRKGHYRWITPREAANLQSFHGRYKFTGSDKIIYKQLGNSVNVRILKLLGENLFKLANKGWDGDSNGEKN
jgi:DNA (cytosine-5)-methyltransferase 1